jgi:hypothetical protein
MMNAVAPGSRIDGAYQEMRCTKSSWKRIKSPLHVQVGNEEEWTSKIFQSKTHPFGHLCPTATKELAKRRESLGPSTTPTASLISPSLATSLAPNLHGSRAAALGNPFPPPPTPLTNSLAKLAGAYSCLLKIDNLKNEDDKAKTELYVDFLSGFMVDGNTMFLDKLPNMATQVPCCHACTRAFK